MNSSFPRRRFLTGSAFTAAGVAASNAVLLEAGLPSSASQASANDRVRFGMIGVGMQGSGLLANAVTLPGLECVAASDLYDGRHTLAKQITNNPNLPTTRHYKELLDRKDIDCIVAAVPDFWHK